MTRLMSVSHTTQQVRDRTKTVTRRQGWWEDKNGRRLLHAGNRLTLCVKVMGRTHPCEECEATGFGVVCPECEGRGKVTDPLERIASVIVVAVTREPLDTITPDDVTAEGFPGWTPAQFIHFYCGMFGGRSSQPVTRVEWRYLDA